MITLLLDLDDTLLENSMDVFLPAYLQALSVQLEDVVPARKMTTELLAATRQMIANQQPGYTLEEVFDRHFYPGIGASKAGLLGKLNSFYGEIFPHLKNVTRPKPAAHRMIQVALERGYTMVVATNPLFPETAVHQRLSWAGFSPADTPFHLISHYSTFHFSKPNPAYYAEILAVLGWQDHPAVMVGNELADDILPASELGLPCYWLQETDPQPLPEHVHRLSRTGDYEGLQPWLDEIEAQQPEVEFLTPEALKAVLRATPAAIDQWVRTLALPKEGWDYRLAEDEWGLVEIVCHLRDGDSEVHMPRIERVIQGDNPHIAGQNTDPWAADRHYRLQNGPAALRQFIECRTRMLSILDSLSPAEWQLPAQHTIFGPTTLQELVSFIATHDRTHILQAFKTLQAWKKDNELITRN